MPQHQIDRTDREFPKPCPAARVALRPTGDLDVATAPLVARQLRDALASAPVVLLDLRGLVFMDVVGMHVVVEASERARSEGRRLEVIRGPAHVDAVFTLTGTDVLLDLAELDDPPVELLAGLPEARSTSVARYLRRVHDELAAQTEQQLRTHLAAVMPMGEASVMAPDAGAHRR